MPIPLPNLDDRRWSELVEQGRALIPLYAPEWTDHNASDPGITLIELFAWLSEIDVYRVNRVTEQHKRRYLSLLGLRPEPPRAGRCVVTFDLRGDTTLIALPASLELSIPSRSGEPVSFGTLADIDVIRTRLSSLFLRDARGGTHDWTINLARGERLALLGVDPEEGATLHLGFTNPLPSGRGLRLFVACSEELGEGSERASVSSTAGATLRPVRTAWEYFGVDANGPEWLPLDVDDDTASFTRSGGIELRPTHEMISTRPAPDAPLAFYVRCRLVSGRYDAPPGVTALYANAVEAVQSTPAWQTFTIARNAQISGVPTPGQAVALRMRLVAGAITELVIDTTAGAPLFRVAEYVSPTPFASGKLTVGLELAGVGDATPNQRFRLARSPVVERSFELYTLEGTNWRHWERQDELLSSSRSDAHYVLHPSSGEIMLGDGEHGRVAPSGALVVATYESTLAETAEVAERGAALVTDGAQNRALGLHAWSLNERLTVGSAKPSERGEAAEALAHACGRAARLHAASRRAVSVGDFETLALETPGAAIARVKAIPGFYPGLDCVQAAGVVTVVVVPAQPGPRPLPSAALLGAVRARLDRLRLIGTRVVVIAPGYVELSVRVRVRVFEGVDRVMLRARIAGALDGFLHPLHGGPDGTGWPFGRHVLRSEILQVLDETPGVDHVLSLEFFADGCGPLCGNVRLCRTFLVAASAHQIEVE